MSAVIGFEILSWYGVLVALGTGYVFWAGVIDTGHRHFKAVNRRLRQKSEAPLVPPAVILQPPSYSISVVSVPERKLSPGRYRTRLDVMFRPFKNNEAAMTLRSITVGIRRRSTGVEAVATERPVPSIAPGGVVEGVRFDAPDEAYDGLTEQNYQGEILTWARFDDPEGRTWEVVWDPVTRDQTTVRYTPPST